MLLDELIGEIFESNKCGKFKVIKKCNERTKSSNSLYEIEFVKTGYRKISAKKEIQNGGIKDIYFPRLYGGVGYIGDAKMVDNKRIYDIWQHMLSRCYNKKSKMYSFYGKKGVTVDKRWHCFEYFLKDFPAIEGYDEWLDSNYELDKDIKQQHLPHSQRVYSLKTCTLVSSKENSEVIDYDKACESNRKLIKATSPSGEEIVFNGIRKFCREYGEYNLKSPHVANCLKGKQKQTKGWKFEYAE